MCAPLWSRDAVIGVIYIDSPLHAGTFSGQDLDLLTALANFAAVAIERARLHEHVLEQKRIRGRLERYHSPQVVEEIIADVDVSETGDIKPARTKVVTILFADLVGFTTWSEKMPAETLARMLTEFFTLASDAVFACGGTIDKFIGDAVMAFFGAPLRPAGPCGAGRRRRPEDPRRDRCVEPGADREGRDSRSRCGSPSTPARRSSATSGPSGAWTTRCSATRSTSPRASRSSSRSRATS